jgi:hypothetical protein
MQNSAYLHLFPKDLLMQIYWGKSSCGIDNFRGVVWRLQFCKQDIHLTGSQLSVIMTNNLPGVGNTVHFETVASL